MQESHWHCRAIAFFIGKWREQCNVKLSIYQMWNLYLFFNMHLFAWICAIFPSMFAPDLQHELTWRPFHLIFFCLSCVRHFRHIDLIFLAGHEDVGLNIFHVLIFRVMKKSCLFMKKSCVFVVKVMTFFSGNLKDMKKSWLCIAGDVLKLHLKFNNHILNTPSHVLICYNSID